MKIRILYTGRSYTVAERLPAELSLADGSTTVDLLNQLESLLADDQPLPSSCLVAVAGEHLGTVASHATRALRDGDELVLIAPVAGG